MLFQIGYGQNEIKQHKVDSLKLQLKKDSAHIYRFRKVRPFFSLDNRNSFIKDAPVNVQGLQLGVVLKQRHIVGLGYYTLQANSKQNATKKTDNTITVNRTLSLKYLTAFYQYAIFDKRYFGLDLPLEIGIGGYDVKTEDAITHKILVDKKGGTAIVGGGVGITIKPFKWFGITGSGGYRYAFDKDPTVNFSGAYYSYGVWLGLGQVYRDVKYYWIKRKKCRRKIDLIWSGR